MIVDWQNLKDREFLLFFLPLPFTKARITSFITFQEIFVIILSPSTPHILKELVILNGCSMMTEIQWKDIVFSGIITGHS